MTGQPRAFTPLHPAAAGTSALPLSFGTDDGDYVFVSGMVGYDLATGRLVGPDPAQHDAGHDAGADQHGALELQTRTTLDNVVAVLAEAELTPAHVVRLTVYLADIRRDFPAFNAIYREYFPGPDFPARTALGVTLADPALLVEVDAIARKPR